MCQAASLQPNNSEFKQWKIDTETSIKNIFGKESEQLQAFKGITYKYRQKYLKTVPNTNFATNIYGSDPFSYSQQRATRIVDDLESGLERKCTNITTIAN